MDFFQAQDDARSRTRKLVFLYFVAMLAIVCAIYLVAVIAGLGAAAHPEMAGQIDMQLWNPELFFWVCVLVVGVVGGASLFKISSMGQGGAHIAKSLGGREVEPSTGDPYERKLLNIVEEMSIASGVPMPDVYILDGEEGINAFAAGYRVEDAAIGVTRGAVRNLTRDELQGVIAHEFSHILSGDMKLNIRLIGPLFGLLVLAFIGRMFLYSGGGRSRGKNQGGIVLLGLAIIVIGYIGVLFGRMIQAAISRQREYLADAAAVQFTRNPEGIASALRRLGYKQVGSKVQHEHAEDTAHMFFASALGSSFATHPPLPKRIKAILPSWDGSFLPPRKQREMDQDAAQAAKDKPDPTTSAAEKLMGGAAAVAAVGVLSRGQLQMAIEQRVHIQEELGGVSLGDSREAFLNALALLINPDEKIALKQRELWASENSSPSAEELKDRAAKLSKLSASEKFSVLELSHPGFRKMDTETGRKLEKWLVKLAAVDEKRSLQEQLVIELVQRQLESTRRGHLKDKGQIHDTGKLGPLAAEILFLVSFISSKEDTSEAASLFQEVCRKHSGWIQQLKPPSEVIPNDQLHGIFESLERAPFARRKEILHAAADIVLSDGKTSDSEWTVLRLLSLCLGVPMPVLESS